MKNFTQQEVQFIHNCIEAFGKTNGIRYFQSCALMANKVLQEYNAALQEKQAQQPVVLAESDLAPANPPADTAAASSAPQ